MIEVDPVAAIATMLAAATIAAVVLLPAVVWSVDGLCRWVLRGPKVLPVVYDGPEVYVLEPYRYQTREQVKAYQDRAYWRWERRRARSEAVWRVVSRVLGRTYP